MPQRHSIDEIRRVIQDTDAVHVSTVSGPAIRSRMMHFGLSEGFEIYLASMKGDPKTVQLAGNQHITLLFRKTTPDERDSAEVEITGLAEIVKDDNERQKGFTLEAPKSSIVRGLMESGNARLLDCIKVRPIHVRYRVFREITVGVPPTVYDFPQNTFAESNWRLFKRKAKLWVAEVRAPFATASVLPVILGAMIAFVSAGVFDSSLFILTLVAGVLMHFGTNVFNDYFDHRSTNDEVNKEFVRPFSGGSRMIQLGLLSPLEVLSGAIFLFAGAGLIGVYLAWVRGWPIIALGLVGLASGYFYTAPPLNIVSRGVGELFVGLNFGILMTVGSYYVQTLGFSWAVVVASLPLAFLIAAVLYINEFPDYKADMAVGKRHLVVRMGREQARWGVPAMFAAAFVTIILGALTGLFPPYTLIALLAVPFGIKASRYTARFYQSSFDMAPGNAATILGHMFTGILLIGGFASAKLETAGTGYVVLAIVILAAAVVFIYWSTSRRDAALAGIKNAMA